MKRRALIAHRSTRPSTPKAGTARQSAGPRIGGQSRKKTPRSQGSAWSAKSNFSQSQMQTSKDFVPTNAEEQGTVARCESSIPQIQTERTGTGLGQRKSSFLIQTRRGFFAQTHLPHGAASHAARIAFWRSHTAQGTKETEKDEASPTASGLKWCGCFAQLATGFLTA